MDRLRFLLATPTLAREGEGGVCVYGGGGGACGGFVAV